MKNKNYLEEEIDLDKLFSKLWKEKITIFITLVLSVLIALQFYAFSPKRLKISITLVYPENYHFHNINILDDLQYRYNQEIYNNEINRSREDFINIFQKKLFSKSNFSFYLKEKKIDDFDFDFEKTIVNKKVDNFFFIYPIEVKGIDIINNYILFVKDQTVKEYLLNKKKIYERTIRRYVGAIEIAKEIELAETHKLPQTIKPSGEIFFLGTKVLNKIIIQINKELSILEKYEFEYNPILETVQTGESMNKPKFHYILGGLIIGFFLSLMIIFFRSIIKS